MQHHRQQLVEQPPIDEVGREALLHFVCATLPVDPDQPGITATTRAIGSINSKNGAQATLLAPGEPVSKDEVMALFEDMRSGPFKTVVRIAAGSEQLSPCPVCSQPDTSLKALDHVGTCYGSCGRIQLDGLYDVFLAPRPAAR